MREMLALPARLGVLGLTNPVTSAKQQRAASQQISAPLVDRIVNRDHQPGRMGCAATVFYKRFASMIAEKRDVSYAVTLNWIRCRLSFALLRASIMSIRGARSSRQHPATECPIDLQLAEGHLS